MLIAGGGVHYADATSTLRAFAERHGIPVVETVAGKATLTPRPPELRRPDRGHGLARGQRRRRAGRRRHRRRDAAAGLHHRLLVGVPRSGRPVRRHQHRVVGCPQAARARRSSATRKVTLEAIDAALGRLQRPHAEWLAMADERIAEWHAYLDSWSGRKHDGPPAYAEVIQAINAVARSGGLHPVRRRRPARRAEHGLAVEVGRLVRLRVRLLDDGLRDRRRVGRPSRAADRRRHRLGRRRVVPDDELRHLLDRAHRPEGHLHGLRQRRVRRDQPAPGQHRRRRVQQPPLDDPSRALLPGRLRQACGVDGRHRRARGVRGRPRCGVRAGQGGGPQRT